MRFKELFEEYKRPESDKHFDRNQLPQIRRNHIEDSPFDFKEGTISLDKIKPVQSQRVQGLSKKAQDVFKNKEDRPFIIDKNNYLINGHHRYDAAHELGITKVKVIKINADIEDVMKHFSHTASDKEVMAAKLQDKIKQRLDAEAGGGGGAGGGAGAGGSGGGASAGGDGGSTGSSGDGGSADSGDTGSSDSAPTSDAPVSRGFSGIGTYMPGAKRKKKKKKNYGFGKGIYETIEAMQDLNSLLLGIDADLKQREKDLKKLPKKSIYDENFADGKVKGKSRPGRVKKAGASCKGSVSSLRAKAKKYSGEKGKMYHWCANMKAGRNKQ